jgi:hypothetical protein
MRISFLTSFFLLAINFVAFGQKYLIIEKSGKAKTERLNQFDDIIFQLKDDDKGWYTRQILDLNADAQLILLGDVWMPLTDIVRIKLKRKRLWSSVVGGALMGGGASMFLGDLYYTLTGRPEISEDGMEFGVVNMAVGAGIMALFGPIKYNLGKRVRLRAIDITFRSSKT